MPFSIHIHSVVYQNPDDNLPKNYIFEGLTCEAGDEVMMADTEDMMNFLCREIYSLYGNPPSEMEWRILEPEEEVCVGEPPYEGFPPEAIPTIPPPEEGTPPIWEDTQSLYPHPPSDDSEDEPPMTSLS